MCNNESLIGLLAWLSARADQCRPLPETADTKTDTTTVLVVDEAVANSFQVGCAEEIGPFVAYPHAYWWFASVWRGFTGGPLGLALLADYTEPVAVILPSAWPQAMAEWIAQCRALGCGSLVPWSATYEASLSGVGATRRPVTALADLDLSHLVTIMFEEVTWLDPWLQSP